ncbi:50S ribosomal protein L18 [Candidatus Woesebacteria bacterium RIFOXYB1_FULL_38_16]|uniref:Large ribosomal subunit protein uL18 n=1 Tax=Candidatus Woesebacteria bacterium RIFOXYB1_FULL_38_16 TaxID=1802538 RepID=A0A1F8CUR2_9BACT|nr:MAG: 50S ribosomal protein L18 [Candidatus Woesebacteria bacterium RIFOXYB1_FULL_38_16]
MNMNKNKMRKTRNKIRGTSDRPRLTVFRSNKYLYTQIINDELGKTLASASGKDAKKIGSEIAQRALKGKISQVVFDRGNYRYHGNVKLIADSAREGGLKF